MAAAASQVTITHVEHVCLNCNQYADTLFSCVRCHFATYCTKQCQRDDWKQHKVFCEKLSPKTPPMIKMMLHLEKAKHQSATSLVSQEELRYISSLVYKHEVKQEPLTEKELATIHALSERFEYDPAKPSMAPADPEPFDLNEVPSPCDDLLRKVLDLQLEIAEAQKVAQKALKELQELVSS